MFASPRWLRDLGRQAWYLVGLGLVLVGMVWLLGATATIVEPVMVGWRPRGRREPRGRVARAPVPRPPRGRRRPGAAGAPGARRAAGPAGDRRHRRPERPDLRRAEPRRRQDPGLGAGRGRRGVGGGVDHRGREVGRPGHRLHAPERPGRRDLGPHVGGLLPVVPDLLDVLPAEGRAGVPPVRRPASRDPAAGRDHRDRPGRHVAAAVLPGRHDRRGVQRRRRRRCRVDPGRPAGRDDRGRHVRDRLHPVHRGVRRRLLRRAAGPRRPGDARRR